MAESPAALIIDEVGHTVGVVLDGATYRLQSEAKVARGAVDLVSLDAIDTGSGLGRLKATLYTPDGDPVAFPSTSTAIKNGFVTNAGSPSLLVDGSVTPIEFTYDADPTYDISLQEMKFTLVSNIISFGNEYFGATSGPLANGVLIQATVNDGTVVTVCNLTQNESFVNFASPGGFTWVVSSKDLMSTNCLIGGGLKLVAGSGDKVSVIVRDDIDSAGVYLQCFIKGNLIIG